MEIIPCPFCGGAEIECLQYDDGAALRSLEEVR